jgi:hypothetical protein
MAVGGTEIVIFDAPGTTMGRNRSTLGSDQIAMCGKCGAMIVVPDGVALHVTFHGTGAWVQTAGMTNRQARGPWDANNP